MPRNYLPSESPSPPARAPSMLRATLRCSRTLSTAAAAATAAPQSARARALDGLAEGMARPMTEMEIASGSGSHLTSAGGETFLDFTSGIGVTNTGHCHPRVVAAAQHQLATLLHGQVSVGLSSPLVALQTVLLFLLFLLSLFCQFCEHKTLGLEEYHNLQREKFAQHLILLRRHLWQLEYQFSLF